MSKQSIAACVLASLVLAGCVGSGSKAERGRSADSSTTQYGAAGDSYGASASSIGGAEAGARGLYGAGGAQKRVIYFNFDSDEIRPDQIAVIQEWSRVLSAHPAARLRLEGHADERGTPEYNLGLGERRAQSVRNALIRGGASEGQFSILSYGEQRPVAEGHGTSSWQLNRRVELVD